MKNIIFILALFSVIFSACSGTKSKISKYSSKKTVGVKFVKSKTLSSVLDLAKEKNKLVFVDIYTDWCMPCKMMDEDVFPNKEIGDYINEHFISYKVNGEKGTGPNIVFLYEVYAYPTLLFMDGNGNVLSQKVGAAYHTELKNLASQALSMKAEVN